MNTLVKWLVNRRLFSVVYMLWFLLIPFVVVYGAVIGITESSKDWWSNLDWIHRQRVGKESQ